MSRTDWAMNNDIPLFARWLQMMINHSEQSIRDKRLTGLPAYHDAITDNLLWRIDE